MLHRAVCVLLSHGELALLQLRISRHAATRVFPRQLEDGEVQRMEAGQGHELEFVAHVAQLALELCDFTI